MGKKNENSNLKTRDMKTEECFKAQLETVTPITEEELAKLNKKEYFNGEKIQVGDKVLVAVTLADIGNSDAVLDSMLLTERHFPELEDRDWKFLNGRTPALYCKW